MKLRHWLPGGRSHRPESSSGAPRRKGLRFAGGLFLFLLLVFALLPVLTKTLVFGLPAPSALYDCDDGALAMLDRLTALGIKATPVVGDLNKTGEEYLELNHVWLIAEVAGIRIALDWGTPWLDRQHYEGYPITRAKLLEFVAGDL